MDNHDVNRAMFVADGNIDKYKIALNLILFTRGIPSIFYGTEIGIKGGEKHGELRQPFPGGFTSDDRNAFITEERTEKENDLYNYLQELLGLRQEYPVLSNGNLKHIYIDEKLYVLIKYNNDEAAMILVNSAEENILVEPSQIKMYWPEAKGLLNLKSHEEINLNSAENFTINKMSADIFLIRK